MGMYDTIKIYLDCPYCGCTVDEAQTKDLECGLNTYDSVPDFQIKDLRNLNKKKKKDDWQSFDLKRTMEKCRAPQKLNYVDVICDCHSVSCQFDGDRDSIICQGSPSGFGRMFEGKLLIEKGCFISELKDLKLDGHNEKYFSSYKKDKKAAIKLKRILPKYKNQEVIAVRNWNRER
jgi:hypothetical protein